MVIVTHNGKLPASDFCHNGRFIASAKSYQGVLAMALLALKDVDQG